MVTAYDYPSAMVAEEAGVDIVLVGDSAANVVLGYDRTEPVSMEEMIMLGKAVRRGLKTPLMVGDMPMGSYESSNELAVQNAQRLIKETGCQTVKLEAGGIAVERARAIVRAGIPVMGHVGLTPQTATALGGYKAQGKTAKDAIAALRGRPRPAGGRLLRDRLRGRPGRDHGSDRRQAGHPLDRDRRRSRRPPARSWSSTTCSASPPATWPSSSSATPTSTTTMVAGGRALRRRGARAPLPRTRPRLQRRAGRAGRVPPLPRPGEPGVPEGLGVGAAAVGATRVRRPVASRRTAVGARGR